MIADLKLMSVGLTTAVLVLVAPSALAQWPPARPDYVAGFPVTFPSDGAGVRSSSISLGDLTGDDVPEIVVGTIDGFVRAFTGDGTQLWQYPTSTGGSMAFESKAAIADVDDDGFNEIVIGAGSTFTPLGDGILLVLSHLGELQCGFTSRDTNQNGHPDGFFSSPAVADLDRNDNGRLEIVVGGWDSYVYVLHDDCSLFWEKYVRDSIWCSPVIADMDYDGSQEVIIGVDAHWEPAPISTEDGGRLHVYRADGSSELDGFPVQIDEVIWSSPAVGDLDGDGWLDIVVGTGRCWDNPACAPTTVHPGVGEYINAWNRAGNPLAGWPFEVPGEYAMASPALADLDGDGLLEVVVNTISKIDESGAVYVINGDGTIMDGWPVSPSTPASCDVNVHVGTGASPIVANLDGVGGLEIVLASNWELVIWDSSGNQLTRDAACPEPPEDLILVTNYSVNSAAAAGDIDGDSSIELVVGGTGDGGSGNGAVYAWDFLGNAVDSALPWPQFRKNSTNSAVTQSEAFIFADGFESGDAARWTLQEAVRFR